MKSPARNLTIRPLIESRWTDFEKLFGPNGACAGCWCMFWRVSRTEFRTQKGAGNRKAMKRLVATGPSPGLLAYENDQPVGWCAVAPRAVYSALQRSRLFKPLDEKPVWSVSCLFVARSHRRRGVSVELLKAAAEFARAHGAKTLEGYPQEPRNKKVPDVFAWTGLASGFRAAGFQECARPSPTRPVMRIAL